MPLSIYRSVLSGSRASPVIPGFCGRSHMMAEPRAGMSEPVPLYEWCMHFGAVLRQPVPSLRTAKPGGDRKRIVGTSDRRGPSVSKQDGERLKLAFRSEQGAINDKAIRSGLRFTPDGLIVIASCGLRCRPDQAACAISFTGSVRMM